MSEGGRAAPLMTSSGSARGPSRQNGAEGAEGAEGEEGEKGEEGEEGQESSASFCARFGYLFALSRGLMIASVSMVSNETVQPSPTLTNKNPVKSSDTIEFV